LFFWKRTGYAGDGLNPKAVARALLGTLIAFVDPTQSFPEDEHHPAVFGRYPLRKLLERDYIPATLHDAFEADGRLQPCFDAMRHALVRLARAGVAEQDALRAGEQMLPALIDHLRDKERLFKSAVNPEIADASAAIERNLAELLRRADSRRQPIDGGRLERDLETEATPNEIDSQQITALKHYDYCRLGRLALEKLAEGVHEINTVLDKRRQR
jgi:hypothetical protein